MCKENGHPQAQDEPTQNAGLGNVQKLVFGDTSVALQASFLPGGGSALLRDLRAPLLTSYPEIGP